MALCARCGERTDGAGEFCLSCRNLLGPEPADWPRTVQRAAADYLRPFAPEGTHPTALRSIGESEPWPAEPAAPPEPGGQPVPSPSGQLPDFPPPRRPYGTASGGYERGRGEPLSPATGSPALPYSAREVFPEASQDLFDTPTDPFRPAPDPYRRPQAAEPYPRSGRDPLDAPADPDPHTAAGGYDPPAGGHPDPLGTGCPALPNLPDAGDARYHAAPAAQADPAESAERGEPWWTARAAGATVHDPLAGISEPGKLRQVQLPVPPARPPLGDATSSPPAGYAGLGVTARSSGALPAQPPMPQPGWTAGDELAASPAAQARGRGMSSPIGRWVAAAVVVVLVGAGGAALLLSHHGKPPSDSGFAPRKPVSAPSTPAATTLKDGLLYVTTAAARAPHAATVERFLVRYFTAINDHDYTAYRQLFSASLRGGLSAVEFSTGYGSSQDSQETLRGISAVPAASGHAPELKAQVTFNSHQSPASSPTRSACTAWTIAIYLVKQGRAYAIVSPPADYQATFGDC